MNNHALFYNSSGGDRKYGADDFSDWMKKFFTDGVINGELQVIANDDMTVTVRKGTAQIGGKVKNFAETIIRLDTANGSYDRVDSIVIRRDDTRRDFFLDKVTGSPSSSPTAKSLVRSGNIYEIKIAEVRVKKGTVKITQSAVKDCRPSAGDCGWITGTVKTIDFTQFTQQFEAFANEYKDTKLKEIDTWFNNIKGQISTDAAVNIQLQIDQLKDADLTFQAKIKSGTTLPASGKEGDLFILLEK